MLKIPWFCGYSIYFFTTEAFPSIFCEKETKRSLLGKFEILYYWVPSLILRQGKRVDLWLKELILVSIFNWYFECWWPNLTCRVTGCAHNTGKWRQVHAKSTLSSQLHRNGKPPIQWGTLYADNKLGSHGGKYPMDLSAICSRYISRYMLVCTRTFLVICMHHICVPHIPKNEIINKQQQIKFWVSGN